ncbi:hypothetical protein D3C75_1376250 [compost metagenome]
MGDLQAKTACDGKEGVHAFTMQDPIYCLIEQHFRLILVQDSLLWWHACFKCEALK